MTNLFVSTSVATIFKNKIRDSWYKAVVNNEDEYVKVMCCWGEQIRKKMEKSMSFEQERDKFSGLLDTLGKKHMKEKTKAIPHVPWMRKGVDDYEFKSYLADCKTQSYLEYKEQIVEMFEFWDEFYPNLFEEKKWREFKINNILWGKSRKKKYKENFFRHSADQFFKEIMKMNEKREKKKEKKLYFYNMSPRQIDKILDLVYKPANLKFPTTCTNGRDLVKFMLIHLIKRKKSKMNFYCTDFFILGKLLKSIEKVSKCRRLAIPHHSFLELMSLSGVRKSMKHLEEKKMFLCFGITELKPPKSSLLLLINKIAAKIATYGTNHVFFVLGGTLFDWSTTEFVRIESLAASGGARFMVKLHDELQPVPIKTDYLCFVVSEIYKFNCFMRYRKATQGEGRKNANCHDFCDFFLDYVFKDEFAIETATQQFVYPKEQVNRWKKIFQGGKVQFVPENEGLKKKLLQIFISDPSIFKEFFETGIFVDPKITKENVNATNLKFKFKNRYLLDMFAKTVFNEARHMVAIKPMYYPNDLIFLKCMDRALVINDQRRVSEGQNVSGPFLSSSSSSHVETGKGDSGLSNKGDKKEEDKKWFFNRPPDSVTTFGATDLNPRLTQDGSLEDVVNEMDIHVSNEGTDDFTNEILKDMTSTEAKKDLEMTKEELSLLEELGDQRIKGLKKLKNRPAIPPKSFPSKKGGKSFKQFSQKDV